MSEETEGSVLTGNPESSAWTEGLDDYKETIEAKGWKSNADVLKSYVNLEKTIGADKITLPSADSNLSEWDGWAKLGTPEKAEDYALAAPDGYETYDQGLSDWFRETAHEAKIPAVMAQQIHDKFVERAIAAQEEAQASHVAQQETWTAELQKEFGTAFDERIATARKAVRAFGSEGLMDLLNQTGLGSHPEFVKAWTKIGMELGSGSQFKDIESSGKFGTTPEMAKEQIAQLRANPAIYDASHPEYKVLNDKLTSLTELAFGKEVLFTTGT
jgi:hypothetical protein